jgi:hypothetical protein
MKVKPMGMLLMMLAGWINRHQQDVIMYLKEENRILREKLGTKRILLSDNQRMRLAWLAKRRAEPSWPMPVESFPRTPS